MPCSLRSEWPVKRRGLLDPDKRRVGYRKHRARPAVTRLMKSDTSVDSRQASRLHRPFCSMRNVAVHSSIDGSVPSPMESWLGLVTESQEDGVDGLLAIYRNTRPASAELIFTGECDFACQHCIYPPNYGRLNPGLGAEVWGPILRRVADELSIRTFVYGGRSLTIEGMETLSCLRADCPSARIGVIDNGISMVPYRDQLPALRLDWIDVSFDGLPADHDAQRCRPGSFRAATRRSAVAHAGACGTSGKRAHLSDFGKPRLCICNDQGPQRSGIEEFLRYPSVHRRRGTPLGPSAR